MCLTSCPIELATNNEAIRARITAKTVAPPPKPTTPRRNSAGGRASVAGAGPECAGTSPDAIGTPHRARWWYRCGQIVWFGPYRRRFSAAQLGVGILGGATEAGLLRPRRCTTTPGGR